MQDVTLTNFYRWWVTGVSAGCRPDPSLGLCANLGIYTWKMLWRDNLSTKEEEEFWTLRDKLQCEMKQQFSDAGLSRSYPFNSTYKDYVKESTSYACHTNPLRVHWVYKKLEEAGI